MSSARKLLLLQDVSVPAYEGTGGIASTASANTIAVSYPTLSADYLLILQVAQKTSATFTTPSGWTVIGGDESDSNMSYEWYRKIATGSESGTLSVNSSATDTIAGIMYCFSNVNTTTALSDSLSGITQFNAGHGHSYYEITSSQLITASSILANDVTVTFTSDDMVENSNLIDTANDWTFCMASGSSTDGTLDGEDYDWDNNEWEAQQGLTIEN